MYSVQDAIGAMRQTTGDDNGSVWHDDCRKGRKKPCEFNSGERRVSRAPARLISRHTSIFGFVSPSGTSADL